MIVIKVELHPGESGSPPRELERLVVANDETSDDPAIGHYNVYVSDVHMQRLTHVARVVGYQRLERSVWELAARAIRAAFPGR